MARRTPLERFLRKVNKTETCWLWTGSKHHTGYGSFSIAASVSTWAHRWAYEHFVGPIPVGLELDHLCRTPACVRPDHLEPVTHAENMRRVAGTRPPRTHCSKGHELTPENSVPRRSDAPWQVRCRICQLEAQRAYTEENRESVYARAAARRAANPDVARAAGREYQRAKRAKDPEAVRLYQLAWREKNREHVNAQAREYQRRRRQAPNDV